MRPAARLAVVACLSALALPATAEPTFTDEGWYSLGPDADPTAPAGVLQTVPAYAVVAPAAEPEPVEPPRARPASRPAPRRSCVALQGAYVRRLLSLSGFDVSAQSVSDEALGQLGGAPGALLAPGELRLLDRQAPVPPGLLSADWELAHDAEALLVCLSAR